MSVPKSKRNVSKLEAHIQALKLRSDITALLLKDLCVKDHIYDVKVYTYDKQMSLEDEKLFINLCERYKIQDFTEEFPRWLINHERQRMLEIADELLDNLKMANSIYATNLHEYQMRRDYQTKAIGCCQKLEQEMQYCLDIFHVDARKYMPITEQIEKVNKLIIGWRKSENGLKKSFRSQENNQEKIQEY